MRNEQMLAQTGIVQDANSQDVAASMKQGITAADLVSPKLRNQLTTAGMIANGFLLTSLFWSSALAMAIDRRLIAAAISGDLTGRLDVSHSDKRCTDDVGIKSFPSLRVRTNWLRVRPGDNSKPGRTLPASPTFQPDGLQQSPFPLQQSVLLASIVVQSCWLVGE